MPPSETSSLLRPGETCWRVERADRLALIVDGEAYFRALRPALLAARRQILLIGWDFDFEIDMLPGESDANGNAPDGAPNRLGDFLEHLVERRQAARIHILKWSGSALVAPGRFAPAAHLRIFGPERIQLALDGHHPVGACHHQKIVVIDDCFAFCGGIDATDERWDTSEHRPGDPRRTTKHGEIAIPWHDATTAFTGPAAHALGELARLRWERAKDERLEAPERGADIWPDMLDVALTDIPLAIARTEPPEQDRPLVNEIEELSLAAIAAAEHVIYIESQYFSAETITEALLARLREPDGPEIVVINPSAAREVIEDKAMHVTRSRMIDTLMAADPGGRFRIWSPVNAAGEPIYVHAKIAIVDDRLLRIGSSNIDRRSMGFDTECDVAFEGHDDASRAVITAFRTRLLAEHLGCPPERLTAAHRETGRLIPAIERLNRSEGRGLRAIEARDDAGLGAFLADTRFFDPRYARGALERRGVTTRHIAYAAAAGLAAFALWRLWRNQNR